MTNEELDQLETLSAAATAGPWHTTSRCNSAAADRSCGVESEVLYPLMVQPTRISIFESDAYDECSHIVSTADAAFIAAARTAVPKLIAECRRLQGLALDHITYIGQTAETEMKLRADLAAMTEARDEACAIAREWIAMRPPGIDTIADVAKDQLEELRAVGKVSK